MSIWLHHASLQTYNLPGIALSADTLISLGLVALLVTLLCGAVVAKSTRRAAL